MVSDKELMLPGNFRKDRKCILFNIAIVTLVSIIAFGGLVFSFNPKLVNRFLELQQLSKIAHTPGFQSLQIYGFGGVSYADTDKQFIPSGVHFNSSSGEWKNISSMPYAAVLMCGAVIDDKIYLFGGITGINRGSKMTVSNSAMVYDVLSDVYTLLQPMPEPRASCGAAVLDGYIYVAGGTNINSHDISSVIRYNVEDDEWSAFQPMNERRDHVQMVALGRRLYVIGGTMLKTFEEYDPSTDQWSLIKSSSENTEEFFGVTKHDGKIYVLDNNRFEVYSPEIGQWKKLTKPKKYFFTNLLSVNDKLWTIGATYGKDNNETMPKEIFSFDPVTEEWTRERDMYTVRAHAPNFFVVN